MSEKREKKPLISAEKIQEGIDWAYDKAVGGITGTSGCWQLAHDYLSKYHDPKIAARKMANAQITKCTTSGILTSFGGFITIPITLPANLTTVWYMQLQMIAAMAVIGGYNPSHDEVKTLALACLTGTSIGDIAKQAGIKAANKGAKALVNKIPTETIKAINAKFGTRLFTKWGEKGVINIGKMVPGAGAIVGGSMDLISTSIIANHAIKLFIEDKIL